MHLATNVLIETLDEDDSARRERVLHVDRPKGALVVIDVEEKRALPRWLLLAEVQIDLDEGRRRLLRHDPWLGEPRKDDQLTDADRRGRDRAWSAIESVVTADPAKMFDQRERGRLVARVVEQEVASKPSIYQHLRRYWQGGQNIHALIPRYGRSGGPGKVRIGSANDGKKRGRPSFVETVMGHKTGINVDESVRRRLVKMGKEFYENERYTKKRAYFEGLKKYFHDGYEPDPNGKLVPQLPPPEQLPTYRQFDYWYGQASNPDEVTFRREGERAYNLRHRAMRSDSTALAQGPGTFFEIDATVGDVYLVSSRNPRNIIGRPIIYVVVDTFSRLVVGFTVGLEGPSWMGAVLAFENVATDKVEFCASLGIDILPDDWPAHHFPDAVLADRGELAGFNADTLAKAFNVRVANTPSYRADWKPIVERRFGLMNERIVRWLPGAVRETERGDRDYRLDATMTLAHLRKVLTLCFLEHNQNNLIEDYPIHPDMRRDEVRPYPLQLWRWGLKNRSGGLRYFPQEMVRRQLLPREKATVTQQGLLYKKHYYTCDFIEAERWRAKARQNGTWRVNIAYDPWSSGKIWVELDGHRDLLCCDEIPSARSTGDVPWAELELEKAVDDLGVRREEGRRRQARARYDAQIDQVLEEAEAELASAKPVASRAEHLSNITANRQEEKSIERRANQPGTVSAGSDPRTSENLDAPVEDIPMFDPSISADLNDLVDDHRKDRRD